MSIIPSNLPPLGKLSGGESSYLYHNSFRDIYEISKQSYKKVICYKRNEDSLRPVLKVNQEDYEEATDFKDIHTVVTRLKCPNL